MLWAIQVDNDNEDWLHGRNRNITTGRITVTVTKTVLVLLLVRRRSLYPGQLSNTPCTQY